MEKDLKYAKFIANLLDARFELFGIKFGINAFFEIIPGIGDFIATILSLYIVSIGLRSKMPSSLIIRMLSNILLSFIIGLIPFVGDAFYIFYRPNVRNVQILEKYSNSK